MFPLIKLAKKLKDVVNRIHFVPESKLFPLIKLAKKLKEQNSLTGEPQKNVSIN